MNNSFTNVIIVIILVLLVGFGVWYFTSNGAPQQEAGPSIELDLQGGSGNGGN